MSITQKGGGEAYSMQEMSRTLEWKLLNEMRTPRLDLGIS